MESIFRFVLARPGFGDDNAIRVPLERQSPFQTSLVQAHGAENARIQMIAIAGKYAATPGIGRDLSAYQLGSSWSKLATYLAHDPAHSVADVRAQIQSLFGAKPEDLAKDPKFAADDTRAADGIVAVHILKTEQQAGYGVMPEIARLCELVRALVRNDPHIDPTSEALRWVLLLPPKIFPLPALTQSKPPAPAPDPNVKVISDLQASIASSSEALDELMTMEATTSTVEDPPPSQQVVTAAAVARTSGATALASIPPPPIATRTANAFVLAPQAIQSLSATTQAALKARAIDPSKLSLDRIANGLSRSINADVRKLAVLSPAASLNIRMIGTTPIPVNMPPIGPVVFSGGGGGSGGGTPPPEDPPTTHGTLKSIGVADLLVVKQQLKRYEPIDIAHVENVLKGESMDRTHVNSTVTEQFTLTQTETTTTTEQDLESTDRFEMSREVTNTLQQDASLKAGLTISGSYGPTVSFSANMEGSTSTSSQSSTTQSTKYGRDVTQRTAKTVSEKVLQQQSLKVTTTVSDTTDHKIDNTNGAGHVIGIYQWLDKIYEAQVFNYGKRALFDFSVPEPAAFAIAGMKSKFANATDLRKPSDFNITPLTINEWNYAGFALEWEASGINPPPEPFVTVAKTFHGGPDTGDSDTKGFFDDAAELVLPDGYSAVFATASSTFTLWENDGAVDIAVGTAAHRFANNQSWTWNVSMAGEVGGLAVALKTYHTATYVLTLEVKCQRTPRAMDKWRNETYNTLLQAFQSQRAAYEDKLAALQVRAGVEIAGRNPDENRMIEKTELKKSCIAIMTAQNFEVFGSVVPGADGLPNIDFTKSDLEGPYIRFFEEAFEWENVTYVFYPYFWAKRDTWLERFNYDDVDPLFNNFLQAGEARVVAPVRPGFELAIAYFLATGQIWDGGTLPVIGDPLYVSIIDELRAALDAPGDEVPQGDPWEVRIATNLVLLRQDNKLPSWTKQPDGSWTPDSGS